MGDFYDARREQKHSWKGLKVLMLGFVDIVGSEGPALGEGDERECVGGGLGLGAVVLAGG